MTRVTFLRDTETITTSHVCRYSVNHSNVHILRQWLSLTFKFPKVVQAHTLGEVGILGSFVKGFFRDNLSIFLLKSAHI